MKESYLDIENNEQHDTHYDEINNSLQNIYERHEKFGDKKLFQVTLFSCIENAMMKNMTTNEIRFAFNEILDWLIHDFRDHKGVIFNE